MPLNEEKLPHQSEGNEALSGFCIEGIMLLNQLSSHQGRCSGVVVGGQSGGCTPWYLQYQEIYNIGHRDVIAFYDEVVYFVEHVLLYFLQGIEIYILSLIKNIYIFLQSNY